LKENGVVLYEFGYNTWVTAEELFAELFLKMRKNLKLDPHIVHGCVVAIPGENMD
jgi:hypothetical protein